MEGRRIKGGFAREGSMYIVRGVVLELKDAKAKYLLNKRGDTL